MADNFNKFFASIAEKIVEQIHPVNVFFMFLVTILVFIIIVFTLGDDEG